MPIVKSFLWSMARRAASDPRVRAKVVETVRHGAPHARIAGKQFAQAVRDARVHRDAQQFGRRMGEIIRDRRNALRRDP